jgi:hypothetical protein
MRYGAAGAEMIQQASEKLLFQQKQHLWAYCNLSLSLSLILLTHTPLHLSGTTENTRDEMKTFFISLFPK